ncbi:MAG: hypothetical protein RBR50_09420 [Candidatus Izemoplasmatales bacterium]|nr:hypothetical protein [Candidatus Izemoplasmatales bacterium]
MKIEITSQGKVLDLEAKLKLAYNRRRVDYKNLLISIEEGNSLLNEFPKSISNSISKRLIELKYIDNGGNITEEGNKMIDNPELLETETGAYSVKIMQFKLGNDEYYMIPEIRRKLSTQKRDLVENPLKGYETNNYIILDDEIVRFVSMNQQGQSKKVFIGDNPEDISIKINLDLEVYEYGSKSMELGPSVTTKLVNFATSMLQDNPYGIFDFESKSFILNKGLKILSIPEILAGSIQQFKKDSLVIENAPFIIGDVGTAKEYLYKIAYSKLQQEDYYSISDLNDIYINELFDNGIFSNSVKKEMFDFTYEINGFANYLSKKEYESLQYKLNVLEFLLGFSLLEENTDFSKATNYKELVKTFNTYVPAKQVEASYIVMGYPFAKNARNKFPEFYSEFSKTYKDSIIVKKGNPQKVDDKMEQTFKKMEVPVYEFDSLREHYHDRYIIFKLKNNQYKVFLITSEIGQFFKLNSTDNMGLVKELDYQEIRRTNRKDNLVEIIERGIANA